MAESLRLELSRRLKEALLLRAAALKKEFGGLSSRQYPSEGPGQLAEFCIAACNAIQKDVGAIWDEADSGAIDNSITERLLRRHGLALMSLHTLIGSLEQTATSETPFELVQPLQRLARGLLPNTTILFQASWVFNYMVEDITERVRQEFREPVFAEALGRLPDRLVRIAIPRAEARNVLLHGVLAHELGHPIYEAMKLADKILPAIRLDQPPLNEMIDLLAKRRLDDLDPAGARIAGMAPLDLALLKNNIASTLNLELTEVLGNWIKELACDAIGVFLIGAPMILSFAEFAAPVSAFWTAEASKSHPALRLRLRMMFALLEKEFPQWESPTVLEAEGHPMGSSTRYDQALIDRLRTWRRVISEGDEPPTKDGLMDVVSKAAALAESAIIDVSRDAVGGYKVRFPSTFSDANELCERLASLIPPNELIVKDSDSVRTMDISSVMNAGWAFSSAGYYPWGSLYGYDEGRQADELASLLLKALELIEVRRWVEAD